MTKDQLQKELKEKVKEGIKPSDIRKLKRSKSAGDIPSAPPLPAAQLQEQVKFHAQTAANYLKSLQTSQARVNELEIQLKTNPPKLLLQKQLAEKQKEIEGLRQQLENKPLNSELDQALSARHQNLKSWFAQYQKTKQLDQELAENIDEASSELVNQDGAISQLRSENRKLKLTNQSLEKDLELAQRAVQWRQTPFSAPEDYPYLKYALYSLATVVFTVWLMGVKN